VWHFRKCAETGFHILLLCIARKGQMKVKVTREAPGWEGHICIVSRKFVWSEDGVYLSHCMLTARVENTLHGDRRQYDTEHVC